MFTILIPVFNEEFTIYQVLDEINSEFTSAQVLIIDNNSTDNSRKIIKDFISHHRNIQNDYKLHYCVRQGKGNALRSVFDYIYNPNVILHDADLEYHIADIKKLAELHVINRADMTIGVRPKKLIRSHLANLITRSILKIRFGITVQDVLTGARIVSKDILLRCTSEQFAIETEITKIALKEKLLIQEGVCRYKPRLLGKKIKPHHLIEIVKEAAC